MRDQDEVESVYELSKDFFAPILLLISSLFLGLLDSLRMENNLYTNLGALIGGGVAVLRLGFLWLRLQKKRDEIKFYKERHDKLQEAYRHERGRLKSLEQKMYKILHRRPKSKANSVFDNRETKKPEE